MRRLFYRHPHRHLHPQSQRVCAGVGEAWGAGWEALSEAGPLQAEISAPLGVGEAFRVAEGEQAGGVVVKVWIEELSTW